jgi:hypothetical protein
MCVIYPASNTPSATLSYYIVPLINISSLCLQKKLINATVNNTVMARSELSRRQLTLTMQNIATHACSSHPSSKSISILIHQSFSYQHTRTYSALIGA